MNKTRKLVRSLRTVINTVGTPAIKLQVGDSINNNRSLTVGQLIRFLNNSESGRRRGLGNQLTTAYTSPHVKSMIKAARKATRRTDAVDVTELLLVLSVASVVPTVSRPLGRAL